MSPRLLLLPVALLAAAGVALAQPTGTAPAKPMRKVDPRKEAPASDHALRVGSKAPGIKADKWIKGSEVKSFESGKVYVMEFWATWCPPCRESIPLLTDLQKTHKDATVIGMASSERKPRNSHSDTRLAVLEKFVKDKGEAMDYTIAYDAAGTMGRDWLRAAGRSGIPCAFVVDGDGKIAWIGNPLDHEQLVAAVDGALKAAKSNPPVKPQQSKPKS